MNNFSNNRGPHNLVSKLKRWLHAFITSKPVKFLAQQMSNLLMSWFLYVYLGVDELEKLEMVGNIIDTIML
jgi:hypothetical protein